MQARLMRSTTGCLPAFLCACLCVCLRACVPACLRACVPACVRACVRACVPACLRACVPACLRACQCAPAWHLRVRRRLPHRESMSGNDWATRAWAPGTRARCRSGWPGRCHSRSKAGGLHVAQLAQSLRRLAGNSRIQISADEVKAAAIASAVTLPDSGPARQLFDALPAGYSSDSIWGASYALDLDLQQTTISIFEIVVSRSYDLDLRVRDRSLLKQT